MKEKRVGNITVIAAIIIFSLNFVSMKFLVEHIPPFGLIFLRFALATLFFNIILLVKKDKQEIAKEDKRTIIAAGFVGVVMYYCFQTVALKYISASLAALICGLIPIFTLFIKVIMDKRRLAPSEIAIFLLSLVGVFMVLDMSIGDLFSSSEIIGFILMILAVFSWIAYTLLTYRLQNKYNTILLISKQFNAATVILLFIALFDLPKLIISFQQVEVLPSLLLNLLFVGIVCSALGYFFYIYGMERIGVEIASLYMNLLPAVTAIASYFILQEVMNKTQITGIMVVLLCLYANGYIDWRRGKSSINATEKSIIREQKI
ncbi:DMT family transporter [Alkaliphilus peptidifermentans]|uniref:Threonine/homoserine efflux transporter RhtA n=1 Tax=Alkaliphilus peptidifermentans DSM 18978 TaxID=1120976 RepID=A0A1G5CWI0_9FIRM|nr:EamA family transporter [Alkaliphilus peptidifermentans]SCY06772.1 Threonine/homoserine efflux transporter RhtA [Alkaliphilus peptidifermentans DSM 18978]